MARVRIRRFEDFCYKQNELFNVSSRVSIDATQTDFPCSTYDRCLYRLSKPIDDGCGIEVDINNDLFCVIDREVWEVVDYGVYGHHEYVLYRPIGFVTD